MYTILEILISNTVIVAVLAAMVYLFSKFSRNYRLLKLMWVLVLLKLITPSFVTTPIIRLEEQTELTAEKVEILETLELLNAYNSQFMENDVVETVIAGGVTAPPAPQKEAAGIVIPISAWMKWIICGWLVGGVTLAVIYLRRIYSFGRKITTARPAANFICQEAGEIAARLGLRRRPEVLITENAISPCLWAVGPRQAVLLPGRLFYQLTGGEQSAVLAHEMSHLRRRDHWLRRLEFVVLSVYWWNPLVWLIMRQVRQVEEYCCDAYVTWIFPEKAKEYARALIKTVNFLSDSPVVAPRGACSLTNEPLLFRRIEMIVKRKNDWRLSLRVRMVMLLLAIGLLPLSISKAENKADVDVKQLKAVLEKALDGQDPAIIAHILKAADEFKSVKKHNVIVKSVVIGPNGVRKEIDLGNGKNEIDLKKVLSDANINIDDLDPANINISSSAKCFVIGPDGVKKEIDIDNSKTKGLIGNITQIDPKSGNIKINCSKKALGAVTQCKSKSEVKSFACTINTDNGSTTVTGEQPKVKIKGKCIFVGPDGKEQVIDLGKMHDSKVITSNTINAMPNVSTQVINLGDDKGVGTNTITIKATNDAISINSGDVHYKTKVIDEDIDSMNKRMQIDILKRQIEILQKQIDELNE